MARKKPQSAKQKKAQLQEKRAIKRGDIPAPPPPTRSEKKRRGVHGRSTIQLRDEKQSDDPEVAAAAANLARKIESSRKLQSTYLKMKPEFLAAWKEKAANEPLRRPVPDEARYVPSNLVEQKEAEELSAPKRPKWRFEMSKKEVEANEEAIFQRWMADTEAKVEKWRTSSIEGQEATTLLRSPAYFERNIEVWRQLWRVTELSSIFLVLLDSRCPLLHYPPSLHNYIRSFKSPRRTILVLTKVDVVGQDRADRWKAWLLNRYPGVKVAQVSSYLDQEGERKGQGARKRYIPHIPPASLKDLLEALQQCHKELLEPPPHIRDNPEKHSSWKPRVRREVDWTALYRVDQENRPATSGTTRPDEAQAEDPAHEEEQVQKNEDDSDDDALDEPNGPLTVGLIGQPNVGKSSLLNALFGSIKVRASRTPGKTKHFQTLFWSPELRLVDCPGLVLPNLVPLELQVLSSIIPISRVSSIPSCIFNAGNLLPLERVFNLRHPSEDEPEAEDKRTWRGGMKPSTPSVAQKKWTAMDVLTAYANKKGWVTAKAGRPDVNRAGNAILRALAENRVPWAFEPPSSPSASTPTSAEDTEKSHDGIWLADSTSRIDETDAESEVDDGDTEDEDNKLTQSMKEANISEEEEEEDEEEEDWIDHTKPAKRKPTIVTSGGMFGALVEDDDEDEEESNEDEDGSEEG